MLKKVKGFAQIALLRICAKPMPSFMDYLVYGAVRLLKRDVNSVQLLENI